MNPFKQGPDGESYQVEEFNYCPYCGKNPIFLRQNSNDYYLGDQYVCRHCAVEFHMPSQRDVSQESYWLNLKQFLFDMTDNQGRTN